MVSGHAAGEDGVEGLAVAGEAGEDDGHVAAEASANHDPHLLSLDGQRQGGAGHNDGDSHLPVGGGDGVPPGGVDQQLGFLWDVLEGGGGGEVLLEVEE